MLPGFPVAFRRTGIRFLGILFPPRTSAPLAIGLPDLTTRTRRGYHVPHNRDSAGLGALFTPRPTVLPRPASIPRSPLAASSNGQALSPRSITHLPGLSITRHHRGFTHVRPPSLPLARSLPRMGQGPLGFFPGLRTPTGRARGARQGGDGHRAQARSYASDIRRPPFRELTRIVRPRVADTVWMWAALLAINLSAWLQELSGLDDGAGRRRAHLGTLRHQLLAVPARLVRHAGQPILRLPPGQQLLAQVLARLRQLPIWTAT